MSSRLEPYRLKYNPGKGTASAKVRHKKCPISLMDPDHRVHEDGVGSKDRLIANTVPALGLYSMSNGGQRTFQAC